MKRNNTYTKEIQDLLESNWDVISMKIRLLVYEVDFKSTRGATTKDLDKLAEEYTEKIRSLIETRDNFFEIRENLSKI